MSANTNQKIISVTTSARLHLGFFDLHATGGRQFGSLGIALAQPQTVLEMCAAETIQVEGDVGGQAERTLQCLAQALEIPLQGAWIKVKRAIPSHAGLGSGTQMALAIGTAYSALYDLQLSAQDIARWTARGTRSGIGIGTFLHGGVIVDGGRGRHTVLPPVIARAEFPQDWRIILIMDASRQGLHGGAEREAFNGLPRATQNTAENLCWQVLMQALPALAEHDLATFGRAIRALQTATGDYFSPVQGGRYASAKVTRVLHWLERQEMVCFGQSSWGPTGFVIVPTESVAVECVQELNKTFAQDSALSFVLTQACNHGATIKK